MTIKCQKCQSENPDTLKFCGECGTQLPSSEDVAVTVTVEAPREELTTGSTFAGRYQIIEELGRGGMGRVYRAKDTKLNEEVALKLIKPEIASNRKTIERFSNEVKLARKISHRYVGRMYELLEKEGTHYITMEYVSGEDLKSFIRRSGQLAVGTSVRIAQQVCDGLTEAHRLGVIHRDLKPSNIMIDKDGHSRIMDFGIARSMEGKGITGAGVMIGTPEYMPPEQAEAKEVDQRSDIYSLGVILYEMVTGRVPFEGDTPLSIAMKHKGETPKDPREFNSQIPKDLCDVILKCLEKDKDSRYQSAGEVRSELDNIEKGMPTTETKIQERKPLTSKEITVTFGLKKPFIPVSVLVAIITIAIIIWHPWSREKSIPIPSDKPSLAVVYFENVSRDENLEGWRTGLTELLITDLMQSKYIRVLSHDRIFGILREFDLLESKRYSTDDLIKVANEGNVDHIVTGSYMRAGDNIIITLILQKPHTGDVINSIKVECRGEEEIATKVDELTRQIKLDLNLSSEQISSDIDKEAGKITTSSPEAFKNYVEGVKVFGRGDFQKSLKLLEKAISLDPEFAMAYRKIGSLYGNLDYRAKRKEYYEKAFKLADRLSDRERYQIQADYYRLNWKSHNEAVEAFTKLLKLYPDDLIGNGNLGLLYMSNDEWDKAIGQFETVINNREYTGYAAYSNVAEVYGNKGMYDKAMEILESYLAKRPDHFRIHWRLADKYLDQGMYDLAHVEVDKALSLNPTDTRNIYLKGNIYLCQGDLIQAEKEYMKLLQLEAKNAHLFGRENLIYLNIARGTFAKAEKEATMGITLAKELGEKTQESLSYLMLAYLYLNSYQPEKALEDSEKALRSAEESGDFDSLRRAYIVKSISLIKMGELDKAERVADDLKNVIDEGINRKAIRDYYYLQGQKELERGNFSRAIEYFKQTIPLLPKNGYNLPMYFEALAFSYYRSGEMQRSEEQYKELISLPFGRIYYGDIYAKSFYMLGKIYEEQGSTAKVMEHYEKFLDLWKDADPGIAEVEDAKERLVGLKAENP